MPPTKIKNAKVSIGIAWHSFQFNLKYFRDLTSTKDHHVKTPSFSCNGHQWYLEIYPGGDEDADDGYMSIYLQHRSEGSITATYELQIIDKFGNKKDVSQSTQITNSFERDGHGCRSFIKRSDILDESQNILDSDGTLTIAVSIKEDPDVFVPNNPLNKMIKGMFLDEDTAEVCFEVISSTEAKKGKKKKAKASD